jgi:hypothetical protein
MNLNNTFPLNILLKFSPILENDYSHIRASIFNKNLPKGYLINTCENLNIKELIIVNNGININNNKLNIKNVNVISINYLLLFTNTDRFINQL